MILKSDFYILVTIDELIKVLRTGKVLLPLASRFISYTFQGTDQAKKVTTDKLSELGVVSSEDYLLIKTTQDIIPGINHFELLVHSLKGLYCLDQVALNSYQRKFNNLEFLLVDFDVDIEKLNRDNNLKRLNEVTVKEFGFEIESNDLITQSISESNLFVLMRSFKRECNLDDLNLSLINDVFTIHALDIDLDKFRARYKAGENFVKSNVDNFLNENSSVKKLDRESFGGFITGIIQEFKEQKENPNAIVNKLNRLDNHDGFDYLVFKLIYLKLKYVHQQSADGEEFHEMAELYKELEPIVDTKLSALSAAFRLYISSLSYKDIATSYHRYKRIPIYSNLNEGLYNVDVATESSQLKSETVELTNQIKVLQKEIQKLNDEAAEKALAESAKIHKVVESLEQNNEALSSKVEAICDAFKPKNKAIVINVHEDQQPKQEIVINLNEDEVPACKEDNVVDNNDDIATISVKQVITEWLSDSDEKDLNNLSKKQLTKIAKTFDIESSGSKPSLVDSIMTYLSSTKLTETIAQKDPA